MKKLIGMSLLALFAISANAQMDSLNGYSTIVKQKGNGERKVKHIPNVAPPPVMIYTPDGYGVFTDNPFYGYRTHKYFDSNGVKHKVYYYEEITPSPFYYSPYYHAPFYNAPYYYYYR